MCGIVGQITNGTPVNPENLYQSLNAMRHRGPDAKGVKLFPTAIFGHRRLSIIDTDGSPQPWESEDGKYTIIFNGEIYNHKELRDILKQNGVKFRTKGDTEVLLQTYIQYGSECLELLNGMFAFTIWNKHEKVLFAARDRMGEKPFFYVHNTSELLFASELQALLCFKDNIDQSLNNAAINKYFSNQFISGPETVYKNIKQLPPAHYLIYKSNTLSINRYWTLPTPEPTKRSLTDLSEELLWQLSNSVKMRLGSDVPLGAFLSGGLDSATIVALMCQQVSDVKSFTLRFEQNTYNESAEARNSSSLLGTNHYESSCIPNLAKDIPKIIKAIGQPFADSSLIPTWYLCKATSAHVTVALSGDGADEMLGGYNRYQASNIIEKTSWLPFNIIQKLMNRWPDTTNYYGKSLSKKIRLFLLFREQQKQNPFDLTSQVFLMPERRQIFHPDFFSEYRRNDISTYHLEALSPTERLLYVDSSQYLPEDILVKVDRMSMAHSLEVRSPFLDHNLVEFCAKLPIHYKIHYYKQKYLLKRAVSKLLSPQIINRPKHGFASPVGELLKYTLKEYFEGTVFDNPKIIFFNTKEIERLWFEHQKSIKDNGMKLWTILLFYCWYHQINTQ